MFWYTRLLCFENSQKEEPLLFSAVIYLIGKHINTQKKKKKRANWLLEDRKALHLTSHDTLFIRVHMVTQNPQQIQAVNSSKTAGLTGSLACVI